MIRHPVWPEPEHNTTEAVLREAAALCLIAGVITTDARPALIFALGDADARRRHEGHPQVPGSLATAMALLVTLKNAVPGASRGALCTAAHALLTTQLSDPDNLVTT